VGCAELHPDDPSEKTTADSRDIPETIAIRFMTTLAVIQTDCRVFTYGQ
jgi:hypothetical protein